MPWAEFCESYLAETVGTIRDLSLNCIREAMASFKRAVDPKKPADVTPTMVKRFVQSA